MTQRAQLVTVKKEDRSPTLGCRAVEVIGFAGFGKAGGGGLGWAPETFDTSAPGGIWLADLHLDDGYVGALAVVGPPADIAHHRVVF